MKFAALVVTAAIGAAVAAAMAAAGDDDAQPHGKAAAGANRTAVMLTHYSDAQCPCSARVPSDLKKHFLDNADFEGLVDFQQFFVGDLTKNVSKCIHGEEECVGQRHFACVQGQIPPPPYSTPAGARWVDFEACSYGKCTDCAVSGVL